MAQKNTPVKRPIEFIGNEYYPYPGDEPIRGNVYPAKEYEAMYDVLYEDALGYTDTRRNINIALEIICGPDGIPLPYAKGEYAQDIGWPLGM